MWCRLKLDVQSLQEWWENAQISSENGVQQLDYQNFTTYRECGSFYWSVSQLLEDGYYESAKKEIRIGLSSLLVETELLNVAS